jgi:alkylhydroperoxidase family enzyme
MLDLAVTERADLSSTEEIERLRRLGLDDRQMLEVIIVAGFFRDYNLRVSIFGLQIED